MTSPEPTREGLREIRARFAPATNNAVAAARGLPVVFRAGVIGAMGPTGVAGTLASMYRWSFSPSGMIGMGAARDPHHVALIDDRGSLNYAELHDRTSALARALRHGGIRPRHRIGLLARNHRGFIQVLAAHGRLGTDLVLLNTGASAQQTLAVIHEQKLDFLFLDQEFLHLLPKDFDACPVAVSWVESTPPAADEMREELTTIREMIKHAPPTETVPLARRPRQGHVVILTSGTTGTPKGARRPEPSTWAPAAAIMSRVPLRKHRPAYLAAPLFHTWGFGALQLCLALRSTIILRRHFSAEDCLASIESHHPHTIFVVPTMLQRIVETFLSTPKYRDTDISSVKVLFSCGSAIPQAIVEKTLQNFGPVLYNQYGSTEVSWATIATPEELLDEPTTAGKAPQGTSVRILDDDGRELPEGEVGRIFVGNDMLYEGYTRPGNDKQYVDGMVCTGDLGFYRNGLLFISGREDDMIVSGGENVFPRETEDCLSEYPGIREVAVVGVPDERFGQALAAFIVPEEDANLDELSEEKIKAYVKERLARHSVPRYVNLRDELPRNAVGKVVGRELVSEFEAK